jgi:hypothetical protein
MSTIDALADEYWAHYLDTYPTEAHLLGDYTKAGRFEDASREAEDREIGALREFARRADAIDADGLACPPPKNSSNCRPSSGGAAAVESPSSCSPAPTRRPSWRSTSGPIAGSTGGDAIAPPAPVGLIPASSPPRHRRG